MSPGHRRVRHLRHAREAWLITLVLVGGGAAGEEPAVHWGYQGAQGPAHWGELEAGYGDCKLGKHQSPVDIRHAKPAALRPIEFSYQVSPLRIIDTGHSVQVNIPPGSFITVGGHRYDLVQLHFHRPSETRVNGKTFALEAHLVHHDADGKLAVVAVLLTGGKSNAFLAELWKHLPAEKGQELAPESVTVDPAGLLPPSRAYYTFTGSLTTPPCSEEVTWFVLTTPVTLLNSEVAAFAAKYPHNARPVQPLNGRVVEASK